MIITLTGQNNFSIQQIVQSHLASFIKAAGDFGVERLDGEETTLARLQEALLGLPLLSSTKLVVLEAPSKNKQFLERYESLLSNVSPTTEVIIIEPKLDKRQHYYKYLKDHTDFRICEELDHSNLTKWVVGRTAELGGSIQASEARFLVDRVGVNQQKIAHEMDKLLLFDAHITRRSIEMLTDPTPQSTIFQLLEAAFAGDVARMLTHYNEQRTLKVEPPQIIAMLTWQLHILALIKTGGNRSAEEIARDAKLSPFVVRKSMPIAHSLTLVGLKSLLAELLAIDTRLKRESINADEALQRFLLRIALRDSVL